MLEVLRGASVACQVVVCLYWADAPLSRTVATSTAHAEYLAAFDAARDCLRMRVLLADLGLPQAQPTPFFEDNETCIRMASTDASTPRMQHLDARYHWLREQVTRERSIRFVHCPTDLMDGR